MNVFMETKKSININNLELLKLNLDEETVDKAIDDVMYDLSVQRKNDIGNVDLADVVKKNHLNVTRIVSLVDGVEEE